MRKRSWLNLLITQSNIYIAVKHALYQITIEQNLHLHKQSAVTLIFQQEDQLIVQKHEMMENIMASVLLEMTVMLMTRTDAIHLTVKKAGVMNDMVAVLHLHLYAN